MHDFQKYIIVNEQAFNELPLSDETFANDRGDGDQAAWWDEVIELAGFSPEDEELAIGELAEDWNGHARGALVVVGLAVAGHPFAVEQKWA